MRLRGKWLLFASIVAVMALVAGGATAVAFQTRDGDKEIEELDAASNPAVYPVQYSVKFVCGFVQDDTQAGVKPGNYATAINIHNHVPRIVQGGKRVALHYRMGTTAPPIQTPFGFTIRSLRVLEVDCIDIWAMVGVPPHTYLKGMMHIGLGEPLPVTAVYTAQTTLDPLLPPNSGAGISIDVEQIVPIQAPPAF